MSDTALSSSENKRLLALDVFRGMTIAFMILVNTPGSWSHVFSPLRHAKWHGATPTDMVFPFFLFIVGVSMFFSFSKYSQSLDGATIQKVLKRTLMIFLIGLALNYFPFYHISISNLRIMGVLQRIALAYGFATFICLAFPPKHLIKVGAGLLVFYWISMYFLGGDQPYSLEGNFAKQVDLLIFGANHVYKGFGIPFDPEGLFSTIPAIVTVILGYLAGLLIKQSAEKNTLVKNLLLIGTALIGLALIWDAYFPINKPLWTSSYVLYAGGIACLSMGILIEIIDIRGHKNWTHPFVVFGMNPLIIYVLSGVLVKVMIYITRWENAGGKTTNLYQWLYNEVFASILSGQPKLASLLFAIFIVTLCWLFGLFLYKRKIYIKV